MNIDGNDEANIKKFTSITYKTTKPFYNNRNQLDTSENDGSQKSELQQIEQEEQSESIQKSRQKAEISEFKESMVNNLSSEYEQSEENTVEEKAKMPAKSLKQLFFNFQRALLLFRKSI